MIGYDPTLLNLKSNFFFLYKSEIVFILLFIVGGALYNSMNIHEGMDLHHINSNLHEKSFI